MTDGELLAEMGTDAALWAANFCCTVPGAGDVEVPLAMAWFANAIQAGRSKGYMERVREQSMSRHPNYTSKAQSAEGESE